MTADDAHATPQIRAFQGGEGDRWFQRNHDALLLADRGSDPPLRLMDQYQLAPRRVLEVGAANGYRLAALASLYGCDATGVEPSVAAVADGRSRFPEVRLQTGRSDQIPFDEQFDLVIVNFVLHWVDRSLLLKTVAEIDRVVEQDGFLIIGDFDPAHPTRKVYHHLPDRQVFTYKQDYASIFIASGCYQRVAAISGEHSSHRSSPAVADEDRAVTSLLRKRGDGMYAESAS